MTVLDRKLLRELTASKGVLTGIVGIIVVGISSFVTMASSYYNLEMAKQSYYAQCRMADFSVEFKKLPLNELQRIATLVGVTEVRPRMVFDVRLDLDGVEEPVSGRVISMPSDPAPVINNVIIRQGSYFTNQRLEEVIVNESFAQKRGIRPGDRIPLMLNNRRQEMMVVGTGISSEFVYLLSPGGLIPDPENYGVFYVKEQFAEEVFDFQGACNQVVGLLSPDRRERPEPLLRQLETILDSYGVASTTPRSRQPSHWFVSSEITGLRVTAWVLPGIFLSVAALVLNVMMTRRVEQQRTVVGTLKALGYRDSEVFRHYIKFGLIVGLLGGVLGTGAGYLLAELLTSVYRQYYEFPRLVNRPYPSVMLAGAAISVVFSAFGTLRGARAVVRLRAAEAMRPKPPSTARSIVLERWRWFWVRLDFRWHMVLRGLSRRRMRTFVGVISSAIGCALLLVTFCLDDSMKEMVSFQFDKLLLSDFDLSLQDERDFGALYEARHLPGVDLAEPVLNVPCRLHFGHRSRHGAVMGILPDAGLTIPRDLQGRKAEVPEAGLLLTKKLAEMLGVSAGETLTVELVKGSRASRQVPVTGIVDSYLGTTAYADFDYLNRLVGEEGTLNMLQLKVNSDREQVGRFYRALKDLPSVQGVSAVRDQKQQLVEVLVGQMQASIFMVIVFAGLIYFGSILNASLISLAERQQEIGTLRALGYTSQEVEAIFLRESLVVDGVGTILGLPLGYALAGTLVRVYDLELFRMPFVISPFSYVYCLFLGLAFILAAHVPVQRSVRRLNWAAALNVKE